MSGGSMFEQYRDVREIFDHIDFEIKTRAAEMKGHMDRLLTAPSEINAESGPGEWVQVRDNPLTIKKSDWLDYEGFVSLLNQRQAKHKELEMLWGQLTAKEQKILNRHPAR